MAGERHSRGKQQTLKAIGAGAAILIVAGTVGVPFDIVAAVVLGATLVLIVNPR